MDTNEFSWFLFVINVHEFQISDFHHIGFESLLDNSTPYRLPIAIILDAHPLQ